MSISSCTDVAMQVPVVPVKRVWQLVSHQWWMIGLGVLGAAGTGIFLPLWSIFFGIALQIGLC